MEIITGGVTAAKGFKAAAAAALDSGGAQIGPLAWAGFALWLVGIVFEGVGDAQLKAFRADPASKGKVLDTGLWRYTRHPNYFGDCCVWWGIWLAAAEAGPAIALASLIGPVLGAFAVNGAKSWLTVAAPEYWLYFLGALFIVVTLFMPQGIVGLVRKLRSAMNPKKEEGAA